MNNKNHSTTKLLTKEKPEIKSNSEDAFKTILCLPKNKNRLSEGGLRTQGYFKKSYPNKPLISVITVVFNGQEFLEETINSVINQTYDNVEYIIIDGSPTDGTADIIKKYEDSVDYWVSEPDDGIYDAMNKGIDLVTGDWINFMNAGDKFYNQNTLQTVFSDFLYDDYAVLYGHSKIIYPDRTRIAKAGNLKTFWQGSKFRHQSAFISANFHKKHKFNLHRKVAADFEFFYHAYKHKQKFNRLDNTISSAASGGVSDIKRIDAILESWSIVEKNAKINCYYIGRILLEMLKHQIKKINLK